MGKSMPSKKMRKMVCDWCEFNQKCRFYQEGRYSFCPIGSSHRIPRGANLKERAEYCKHRLEMVML